MKIGFRRRGLRRRWSDGAVVATVIVAFGGFVIPLTPGISNAASGMTLTYAQVEGLWIEAGGPPSVAATAAAIAFAESGGTDNTQSVGLVDAGMIQPFTSYCGTGADRTGWGLWQITCGDSEPLYGEDFQMLDPWNNAEAAVSKYQENNTFQPWSTYTQCPTAPCYQSYLRSDAPQRYCDPGQWTPNGSAPSGTHNTSQVGLTYTSGPPVSGSCTQLGDYTRDGVSDFAIWRPSQTPGLSEWYFKDNNPPDFAYGQWGDIPVPGDYNGDGKSDPVLFRTNTTTGLDYWYTHGLTNPDPIQWGVNGDIPVPGDYNGDGKMDIAVWRPSNGTWYFYGNTPADTAYGKAGDIPVPGDWNGDGKTELAIFRPADHSWFFHGAAHPNLTNFGQLGDIPVQADYNGDGKADVAVWRPSNNTWYFADSSPWGSSYVYGDNSQGDIPVPAIWSHTHTADIAVWRPTTHSWFAYGQGTTSWGLSGDYPVSGLTLNRKVLNDNDTVFSLNTAYY